MTRRRPAQLTPHQEKFLAMHMESLPADIDLRDQFRADVLAHLGGGRVADGAVASAVMVVLMGAYARAATASGGHHAAGP